VTTEQPTSGEGVTGAGVDAIVALLTGQRDIYSELLALGRSQRALITGNEPERLLALLAQRQQLIDRLEMLAARLKPYQQDWAGWRSAMSDERGEQVDRLVTEVNALLGQILAMDTEDSQLLAARKSATGDAMQTLKTGRRAGAAYAVAAYSQVSGTDWADA